MLVKTDINVPETATALLQYFENTWELRLGKESLESNGWRRL